MLLLLLNLESVQRCMFIHEAYLDTLPVKQYTPFSMFFQPHVLDGFSVCHSYLCLSRL